MKKEIYGCYCDCYKVIKADGYVRISYSQTVEVWYCLNKGFVELIPSNRKVNATYYSQEEYYQKLTGNK